jgi:hypothetical protein
MGGRCVQPADYPDAPASQLAKCDNGGVCLPDLLVSTKGKVALPRCTSVAGGEGRCVPRGFSSAGRLSHDRSLCALLQPGRRHEHRHLQHRV